MYDANKPYGFINLYDERQPSFNTIFLPEAIYNVLHFSGIIDTQWYLDDDRKWSYAQWDDSYR